MFSKAKNIYRYYGFLIGITCSLNLSAAELDYLSGQATSGAESNILLVLDASSSLQDPYSLDQALVNPASNPADPKVIELQQYLDQFAGRLQNSALIAPSAGFVDDGEYCATFATNTIEGVFSNCTVPLETRWFIRKLDLVRDIVRDSLPELLGNNVGIMRTAKNMQGLEQWWAMGGGPSIDERLLADPSFAGDNGAMPISAFQKLNQPSDILDISNKLVVGYKQPARKPEVQQSPLAESLYESYIYFTGQKSPWRKAKNKGWQQIQLDLIDTSAYLNNNLNGKYKSPMTACSKNHVIMVTDGEPSFDWQANSYIQSLAGGNVVLPPLNVGDNTKDTLPAHTLLDEFAGYLANSDVDSKLDGKQTITTHFVSTFSNANGKAILNEAASKSGGFHIDLTDISQLQTGLRQLYTLIEGSQLPVIGYKVLTTNMTGNPFQSDNQAYINVWERANGRWSGNLKKFNINKDGRVLGKNDVPFVQDDGSINPNVLSLWSNVGDGQKTLQGGAGNLISPMGTKRYTYIGPTTNNNVNLIQENFALNQTNPNITMAMLNVTTTQQRTDLLNWAGGQDLYDIDNDGDRTDLRISLGDQLNAAPAIAHYGDLSSNNSVVFTGSNEGYLHAFNAINGQHLYSFMPQEFLSQLELMGGRTAQKTYGLDAPLHVWHDDRNHNFINDDDEDLLLYFGLRRGGNSFYALDISDRTSPRLAWMIDKTNTDFDRLGQTWAEPVNTQISNKNYSSKAAMILGGGLDPAIPSPNTPQLGNAVYVLDSFTGEKYWSISNTGADINVPAMKYSIISTPVVLDYNRDGSTDAFVFNDIRGQVFRCDFTKNATSSRLPDLRCGLIAQSQSAGENLYFMSSLDAAVTRTQQHGTRLSISLASGNPFEPTNMTEKNRLVTIFDTNASRAPGDYNYSDENVIQLNDLDNVSNTNILQSTSNFGWYFNFQNNGEKSFSKAVVFDNKVYFSTHQPSTSTSSGCEAVDLGKARVYGLNLADGNGLNKDTTINDDNNDDLANKKGQIWEGKARGLPETPYIIIKKDSDGLSAQVNIGVDQTNYAEKVVPVKRSFWYQTK